MNDLLKVGSIYSFDVYPVEIMGNNFKQVEILGIVKPLVAQTYLDLDATHVQVYPYLPQGIPNNARGYDYVMLKTQSGEVTVLGLPWIKADSITVIQAGTVIATISGVSSEQLTRLSDALKTNGFDTFDLKFTSNS